jgi:hypothetical protein
VNWAFWEGTGQPGMFDGPGVPGGAYCCVGSCVGILEGLGSIVGLLGHRLALCVVDAQLLHS